ncbi:MAG TPA: alpha/beta hydrolase [Thermoanaerobaculia bacterium]|nr:alpha/beta hydrolase [Thermoanaerobaculia bacterium]
MTESEGELRAHQRWPKPALDHVHRDGLTVRERAARRGGTRRLTAVWIHGLGESGLGFEGPMTDPRLGPFAHLAPDLLGYGRSPWPPQPLALADHAAQLRGWLQRNALGELILIGHSMGGVIGTLLCEDPEELGRRLVAFVDVEGNVSPTDCTNSATAAAYDLDGFLDHGWRALGDEIYELGGRHRANRGYYASLRLADPRTFHRNSCELVAMSARRDLARRLGALRLPRVYVHGRPGGTQQGSLDLLAEAGVERIAIDGAGHWPFVDRPDAFGAALASWLAKALGLENTS